MPDVRMPDGTVIRNVPEGTTRAQLMARVGKAQKPSYREAIGSTGLDQINEFLIGIPQGLYNAASTITDPIASLFVGDKAVSEARRQRKNVEQAVTGALVRNRAPIARTAGQIASTIPLAGLRAPQILGKAAPVVTRGLQGFIGGAAAKDADRSGIQEGLIGAGANVVLPPVIASIAASRPVRALGRGLRQVTAPVVNSIVNAADDLSEVILSRARPAPQMPAIAPPAPPPAIVPAGLGRAANMRAARFKASGVQQPTTGMVTRDPRAWNFERETAKRYEQGDPLLRQFLQVEEDLTNAGRRLIQSQGGAKGSEATGMAVQKALDAKRNEMQQVTSGLYKQVREARGDAPAGALGNLRSTLDSPDMTDNPVFDTMREGIMRRLQRFGMAGKSGLVRKDAVASISQAEELRKMIRELGPSSEPSVQMMRKRLIDALDDDVVEAVGDDAFKEARASAKARFDEFSKTFAGRIADEAVPPERLTQRLFGATSLSDLRALKRTLQTGTQGQIERGQEAIRSLRGQALEDMFSGVVSPDGKLNGTALFRKFEKDAPKLREILEPNDYKTLRRIVMASRDATAEVPFSAVNNSNTASAAANLFTGLPESKKRGLLGLLAKHGAAFTIGGPAANVGLAVGEKVLAERAASKSAEQLMQQVRAAQNPQSAQMAMAEMQAAARSRADVAALLQRWKDFTGNSPVLGGAIAGATKE